MMWELACHATCCRTCLDKCLPTVTEAPPCVVGAQEIFPRSFNITVHSIVSFDVVKFYTRYEDHIFCAGDEQEPMKVKAPGAHRINIYMSRTPMIHH
jgi:hypothetical protein